MLGHSRGAMVALLAAGTFPERLEHVVLIEGACPRLADAEATAENLAQSIRFLGACLQRPKSIYPTFDAAVNARERGLFPIAHEDAMALARRSVVPLYDGFTWHYDLKLMAGSELKLSEQQVESFCQRITAPCLLIMATEGILIGDQSLMQWLRRRDGWSIVTLTGTHHLHMSEHCGQVAAQINAFLTCSTAAWRLS